MQYAVDLALAELAEKVKSQKTSKGLILSQPLPPYRKSIFHTSWKRLASNMKRFKRSRTFLYKNKQILIHISIYIHIYSMLFLACEASLVVWEGLSPECGPPMTPGRDNTVGEVPTQLQGAEVHIDVDILSHTH